MMLRCSKCKRDKDEGEFLQRGWKLDRVTPMFQSWCRACMRQLDRERSADPEFKRIKRIKRKQRYELTGK